MYSEYIGQDPIDELHVRRALHQSTCPAAFVKSPQIRWTEALNGVFTATTVKDPACDANVDTSNVAATDTEEYQGKRHYLCERACHREFKAAPELYVQ